LLLKAATNDKALGIVSMPERDMVRASILKNMLVNLITRKD